jgi:DNA-directed RNA polymerase specialized sigma24 family protein
MTSDASDSGSGDLAAIRHLLVAMVALQIDDRTEGQRRPTELILADVGLSLSEIATLTGRKYESVKTTIRRARQTDQKV